MEASKNSSYYPILSTLTVDEVRALNKAVTKIIERIDMCTTNNIPPYSVRSTLKPEEVSVLKDIGLKLRRNIYEVWCQDISSCSRCKHRVPCDRLRKFIEWIYCYGITK